MRYTDKIAARLRELREKRGWSIVVACERLDGAGFPITPSSLYKYESGERGMPLDLIPAVARACGFGTARGWLPDA